VSAVDEGKKQEVAASAESPEEEREDQGAKETQGVEETSRIGIRINARSVGAKKNEEKAVSPGSEGTQLVSYEDELIEELGKKYHIPYKIVKEAVIKVKKEDLKSFGDAAALQYKLMTDDAILKASVNYPKGTITVIFNPVGAKNLRPKTELDAILAKLAREGVAALNAEEHDYDYYKDFYSYAFSPPKIRDRPPYGYDEKTWQKIKEDYESQRQKHEKEKLNKFRKWQAQYYQRHRDILDKYPQDFVSVD